MNNFKMCRSTYHNFCTICWENHGTVFSPLTNTYDFGSNVFSTAEPVAKAEFSPKSTEIDSKFMIQDKVIDIAMTALL